MAKLVKSLRVEQPLEAVHDHLPPQVGEENEKRSESGRGSEKVTPAHPADDQENDSQPQYEGRCAQVRLGQGQSPDHANPQHRRHKTLKKSRGATRIVADVAGDEDQNRYLGDLRRLKTKPPSQRQPPARLVHPDTEAGNKDQSQRHSGQHQAQPIVLLQDTVVTHIGEVADRGRDADPHQLTFEEEGAVLDDQVVKGAGAEDHDCAESQQQEDSRQQRLLGVDGLF